ncbi:hypothetical protein L3Q82_003632 [Scortum barcoo]|uniref:Uncharacterized protein n=1 Tax=Scortum barcoo TaxID=214431 RepID=A0ACB8VNA6_9TELE|nr:hypothetical protein L3Q82_003632 [Scortum barcoo]
MENVSIFGEEPPVCGDFVDFYSLTSGNRTDLNCTPPSEFYFYADLYVILPVIYSVICAVGLTGNTAVIYVILKAPKMKTVTNMFILNLAIADDLFTLVLPINIAEHLLHYWPFGEVLCKVILSIDHYNIFSSIYFLTVMSIDRYLVVLATVRSKRMPYRTYRAAKIISLCVWILVILIVMPFTVFAGVYVNPNDGRKSCVLSFPSPESLWFKASRIYTLILGFAIPVSTICILYTMMLYKLRNMRLNSNAKALDKAKKKVTIMVFIVLAVCLFCWTPFHLSTIVALTTDLRTTPLLIGISYFITSLSYANSCLNPFLYAFLDDSFRKAFKKMLEFWAVCPWWGLRGLQGAPAAAAASGGGDPPACSGGEVSVKSRDQLQRKTVWRLMEKNKKKKDLQEVVKNCLERGGLPLSCRRAVITLLPKKGDLQELKNWRPVSLLCTDYKILSKVLASRLREEEGGQGLVHLASRGAAFRLQFLQRLLTGPADLVLEAFILLHPAEVWWTETGSGSVPVPDGLQESRTLHLCQRFLQKCFLSVDFTEEAEEGTGRLSVLALTGPCSVWSISGLSQLEWTHSVQTTESCWCFHSGAGGGAGGTQGWMILLDWLLSWD